MLLPHSSNPVSLTKVQKAPEQKYTRKDIIVAVEPDGTVRYFATPRRVAKFYNARRESVPKVLRGTAGCRKLKHIKFSIIKGS